MAWSPKLGGHSKSLKKVNRGHSGVEEAASASVNPRALRQVLSQRWLVSWRDHELETNKDVNNKIQIHTSRAWLSLGNSKLLYHPGRREAPQCAKISNKSLKEYMFNLYWILRIFMFWYLGCRHERRSTGLKGTCFVHAGLGLIPSTPMFPWTLSQAWPPSPTW